MSSCGTVRLVPGPMGPAGSDGTDGSNGANAFTFLSSAFTMPAELGSTNASVVDTSWMVAGQTLYLEGAGYLEATSIVDATTVTLKNLEDTANGLYPDNAAPGTVIALSSKLSPGGIQGPSGSAAAAGAPTTATYLTRQAEAGLSAEFNLGALTTGMLRHTVAAGVSTPATAVDGTHYLSPTTGLEPADIGVTVQGYDALLAAIAGLVTVADRMIYTTGVDTVALTSFTALARTFVGASTAPVALRVLQCRRVLLCNLLAVDLNTAGDTLMTVMSGSAGMRYRVREIVLESASISLTTATAGVFTSAGGIGTVAADQALATATSANVFFQFTISGTGSTNVLTGTDLYFRVGTPQGAAATANIWIFGDDYTP